MAIPSTTAPVKPQDFTLSPLKVNKQFSINNLVLADTGSGYNLVEGYYTKRITPIGAPQAANDPKNSIDGSYKHVIWRHIDHLYYRDAYTPGYTLEHSNRRYADKFLNLTASYLSMPYLDYGEKIKPNSITIRNTAQNLTVIDDGEGNIYDATLESKLPNIPNNNTIAYWGWNDIFRQLKTDKGTVSGVKYQYDSFTFSPYTYKSDNFYQYNTFWSLVKNKSLPLFVTTCESMSLDKVVNQVNMDYGKRSFKKEPLRAKDLKVRHILDNDSKVHLVSQFILTPAQISYK